MLATAPESIRLKQAELESVQRRIANFVDFVAQGRGRWWRRRELNPRPKTSLRETLQV